MTHAGIRLTRLFPDRERVRYMRLSPFRELRRRIVFPSSALGSSANLCRMNAEVDYQDSGVRFIREGLSRPLNSISNFDHVCSQHPSPTCALLHLRRLRPTNSELTGDSTNGRPWIRCLSRLLLQRMYPPRLLLYLPPAHETYRRPTMPTYSPTSASPLLRLATSASAFLNPH